MIINRVINGESVNIELTAYELRDAYYEQQGIYDRGDVESRIDDYIEEHDDEGITREQLEPLIPEIAERYRKKICDAYDWWDVVDGAIDYIREGEGV